MITVYRKETICAEDTTKNDEKEIELRGLSRDDKPTEINDDKIANGTMFIEIDTGKIYLFDADSEQWKEI